MKGDDDTTDQVWGDRGATRTSGVPLAVTAAPGLSVGASATFVCEAF